MGNEKIFKTKTGFCHILPDKIVLTRDGIVGNIAKVTIGKSILRILIIYVIISFGLFYFAYNNYKNGKAVQSILFGVLGIYLFYGIVSSLNNSSAPIIDRKKIKSVKFKKAIVGLTRSRFEVLFEDDQGKIKKRLIMLPGSLTDGQNETDRALKIMSEEKIITNY